MRCRMLASVFGVSIAALAGCGGWGRASAAPTSPSLQSAPGEAAMSAWLQASHNAKLTAISNFDAFAIQLKSTPVAGTTAFNGTPKAHSRVTTVRLFKNGALTVESLGTAYFLLNPYVPLGAVLHAGTPYQVVASSVLLPVTFTVGSSGTIANGIYYHDSTKAVVDADTVTTYSIAANNSKTVLACLTIVVSNVTAQGRADGLDSSSEVGCYTVDAAGNANVASLTLSRSGATLIFK